jgi:hypothetical protein
MMVRIPQCEALIEQNCKWPCMTQNIPTVAWRSQIGYVDQWIDLEGMWTLFTFRSILSVCSNLSPQQTNKHSTEESKRPSGICWHFEEWERKKWTSEHWDSEIWQNQILRKYHYNRFWSMAEFLSPRISHLRSNDFPSNECIIETEDRGRWFQWR